MAYLKTRVRCPVLMKGSCRLKVVVNEQTGRVLSSDTDRRSDKDASLRPAKPYARVDATEGPGFIAWRASYLPSIKGVAHNNYLCCRWSFRHTRGRPLKLPFTPS